jgi:acyl-CoA reductase-like NAD-dependent aldehyde dehydrogenase
MRTYLPFVNGSALPWNGEYLESIDPSSGLPWCQIARCGSVEADLAVRSADEAFRCGPWSRMNGSARADILIGVSDALESRWEELVEAEVRDNGKRIAEVRVQFSGLHEWYRHFANAARELEAPSKSISLPNATCERHDLPYGVVVAITPWNSPLMILAWKLAPALAAGNTVVVKPSEMASASTLEFAKLAYEVGLPAGVLNVVTGFGHEAGEALVRHPLTRKVTFTGSDAGGRKVAEAASAGIVPTTLELGGKSPQVVFADADIESAANGILSGIFLSNGQTCVAGSRLIVEASIKEAFVDRIVARAGALRIGDPMDPDTQLGPLANEAHWMKVRSMIDRAKSDGAICLLDGIDTAGNRDGYYLGPTVFDAVTPAMQIWREEVFGPVLAVASFRTIEEAIQLANDSDYGLAGGVWTNDSDKGARVAEAIETGTVYVNHYRSVDPSVPIGGVKKSGYGRELGPDAVKEFMQSKSIWTGTADIPDPFP